MGLGTFIMSSPYGQEWTVGVYLNVCANTASNLSTKPHTEIGDQLMGQDILRKWSGGCWKIILPPFGTCCVSLKKKKKKRIPPNVRV